MHVHSFASDRNCSPGIERLQERGWTVELGSAGEKNHEPMEEGQESYYQSSFCSSAHTENADLKETQENIFRTRENKS